MEPVLDATPFGVALHGIQNLRNIIDNNKQKIESTLVNQLHTK